VLAWPPAWSGPRFAAYAPTIARVAAWSRWPTVAELDRALADGLGALPERWVAQGALDDLEGYVRSHFWQARYLPVVKGTTRPF